ncbi:MAG: dihydrofolate reductase [Acidobacteriota bacterium]
MSTSLIFAMSENRVIGRDGQLPWHLPKDLKHFKRLTLNHPIIMGRKTYESIGKPLPKRRSIVLSRDPAYQPAGVEVVHSLEQALTLAAQDDEAFVIGGAGVLIEALPRADRLYLTQVHAEVEGDVVFPPVDTRHWRLLSEQDHPADERHAYPFSFRCYDLPGHREP